MTDIANRGEIMDALVRKHEEFLKRCREEYDVVSRFSISKEKIQQLEFWMEKSAKNEDKEKYRKMIEETNNYIEKTRPIVERIRDIDGRLNFLKGEIERHNSSMCYWTERRKKEK